MKRGTQAILERQENVGRSRSSQQMRPRTRGQSWGRTSGKTRRIGEGPQIGL
jgi:hypothetical protein